MEPVRKREGAASRETPNQGGSSSALSPSVRNSRRKLVQTGACEVRWTRGWQRRGATHESRRGLPALSGNRNGVKRRVEKSGCFSIKGALHVGCGSEIRL